MKTSRTKSARTSSARPGAVHCRRIDRALPVKDHLTCPYCHGREREVQSADHARFCDFEKGKDAVVFGFPDTHGRHRHD